MSRLPYGGGLGEKYDLVYLGNIFKYFPNSGDNSLFEDDYLFFCSTYLNTSKEANIYGHVSIKIVRHDKLSYFHEHLRTQANYHVLENTPLILNDFLEILLEETENCFHVKAHLKNQNLINSEYKISGKRNYQITLLTVYKNNHINPKELELGPEFQAAINLDKAKDRLVGLQHCSSILSNLTRKGKTMEEVSCLLKDEIENAMNELENAHKNCLDYNRELQYIHKRTW